MCVARQPVRRQSARGIWPPPPRPSSQAKSQHLKNKVLENFAAKSASLVPALQGESFGTPCPFRIDQRQRQPDRCCAVEPEISDHELASSEHPLELVLDHVMVSLACRLPLLAVPEQHQVAPVCGSMVGDIDGRSHGRSPRNPGQRVRSLEPELICWPTLHDRYRFNLCCGPVGVVRRVGMDCCQASSYHRGGNRTQRSRNPRGIVAEFPAPSSFF
jgi:hypothetical protein